MSSNQTILKLNKYVVLVSYQTIVAYQDRETRKLYKTEKFWSKTTSRHINQFLNGDEAETKPQEHFDNLL